MQPSDTEALSFVKRCAMAADRFKADMREQGIHVGLGARSPTCAACEKPWPCPDALAAQHAEVMATLCPCGHPYSVHDKERSDGGPPLCNYTLSRRCGCNGLGLEAGK